MYLCVLLTGVNFKPFALVNIIGGLGGTAIGSIKKKGDNYSLCPPYIRRCARLQIELKKKIHVSKKFSFCLFFPPEKGNYPSAKEIIPACPRQGERVEQYDYAI